jgi:2-keto-4-pentenoate hydratase
MGDYPLFLLFERDSMNQAAISEIALALVQARKNHLPADASRFTDQLQTTADAYVVQEQVLKSLLGANAPLAQAWKTGGPNRTSEQTHAALLPEGILKSGADMQQWPLNIRIVEIEVALRINQDVTPQTAVTLSHEASKQFIDAMTVSIEVVDSRWQQAGAAQALLKLADIQSHGALVLGEWIPYTASEQNRNWNTQSCSVKIGDQALAKFVGTHTLQDPTYVLPAWLKHATATGLTVQAGTIVTTGSWCGMPFAKKGDLIVAEFEGIGKTSVQL